MKRPPLTSEAGGLGSVQRREATHQKAAAGPYPTPPSQSVIDAFLDHVRRTGQPETFPTIERLPPPPNSRPVIRCKFDVDRAKRPQVDMAPCAICSPFKPKCLHDMLLVYYPDEGVIRAIGPECGEQIENGAEYRLAKLNYEIERQRSRAEAYIEDKLPRVPQIQVELGRIENAARESTRLHESFRRKAGVIMNALHRVGTDSGGLLTINAVLSRSSEENFEGPRGFGKGVSSSTEYFGPLNGLRMLKGRFNPLADWHELKDLSRSLPMVTTSDEAFYWICNNETLAALQLVESRLRTLDLGYEKLVADIGDVRTFFDPAFFDRLGKWGRHPDNLLRLVAEENGGIFTLSAGKSIVKFKPNFAALNIGGLVGGLRN